MEFKLEEGKCIFYVDTRLFNKAVVFKVAYTYIESYYLWFEYADEYKIKVEIEAKAKKDSYQLENVAKGFHNELLAQKIRYDVAKETKEIRELILGRALYSTCLEMPKEEQEEVDPESEDIDDIAVNWFEHQKQVGEV